MYELLHFLPNCSFAHKNWVIEDESIVNLNIVFTIIQFSHVIMNKLLYLIVLSIISFSAISCQVKKRGLTPEEKKFHLNRIMSAYNTQEWDSVVSWSEAYIMLSDSIEPITILYAEGLAATGDADKAIEILDKQISGNPDNYMCIQTKGNIYMFLGEWDNALVAFEQVLAINPNYARPLVYCGDIYAAKKMTDKAADYYLKAVGLFYENDSYNECMEFTGKVLELQPNNGYGLIFKAATLYLTNETNEYNRLVNRIKKLGNQQWLEHLNNLIEMKNVSND